MPVTQDDAGQSLDFHIVHGIALNLRKVAHLLLGETDIVDNLLAQLTVAGIDLFPAEPEVRRRPLVELRGILAYCRIALSLDSTYVWPFGQTRNTEYVTLGWGVLFRF